MSNAMSTLFWILFARGGATGVSEVSGVSVI
jgi:hypothetical protein